MILEGDCHIIRRESAVCEQMRRFLAMVVLSRTEEGDSL